MKIDGVKLTEGSLISNLTIEGLVSDPLIPNNGEITYNVTSETFKVYGTNGANWQTLITDLVLDGHTTDGTLHFTEASIDHGNILNVGSNTHTQIDTHIGNTALKHTAADIVNTPAGNIAGVNVQLAINELDIEKASATHAHALDDLSDVTITSITNNDFVIASGGSFINATAANSRAAMGALNIAGDTMTGNLEMGNTVTVKNLIPPIDPKDAATKEYVDSVAAGLAVKNASLMATVDGITTFTYAAPAGSPVSGVGATLTSGITGVTSIDGITIANVGDRVLVKDRATTLENGIYEATTVGASGINTILTRSADFDGNPGNEVSEGGFTFVESGVTNANSGWMVTGTASIPGGDINVGVDPIVWTKASGAGAIQAGAGLVQTGNTFNIVSHSGINGTRGTLTIDSGTVAVDLGTTSLTAAAGDHNHDSTYLQLSGGTLTGFLTVDSTSSLIHAAGKVGGGGRVYVSAGNGLKRGEFNFDESTDDVTIVRIGAGTVETQLLLTSDANVSLSGTIASVPTSVTHLTRKDYVDTKEPGLGNPATDGEVLSSTAAGVRSWITASAGGSVFNSDTPPVDKVANPVWFNTATGKTLTWYEETGSPSDSQWVQDVVDTEAMALIADGTVSLNKIENPATDPVPNWSGRVLTGAELTAINIIGTSPAATLWPDGSVTGSSSNGNFVKYPNGELLCYESINGANFLIQTPNFTSWTYPIVASAGFILSGVVQRPSNDTTEQLLRFGTVTVSAATAAHNGNNSFACNFMLNLRGRWK